MLSPKVLDEPRKQTGFAERLRDIHPARLAIAAVGVLGRQPVKALADILLELNSIAPISVEYKPFHNQLKKDSFPLFTRKFFESVLAELTLDVLKPIPGSALAGFDDIVIQDGSSFALHKALADVFPGRFTKVSPAAVELHTQMSLFTDQVTRGCQPRT